MSNYYQNFLKQVHDLMAQKQYAEALKWLEAELKMPYIPAQYENEFNQLHTELISIIKNNDHAKVMPIDQIIEKLFDQSEIEQTIALNLLNKHHLKAYIPELKKRIESWKKPEYQGLLFEIMHDQNLDVDLIIKNHKLNPAQVTFLGHKQTLAIINQIETLTTQNPQQMQIAQNLLVQYVLATFPNFLKADNSLAQDLVIIAQELLLGNTELSPKQQKIKKIIVK